MTEGKIYKIVIDPLLSGLRDATAQLVPDNLNIVDAACGTGALVLELSMKSNHVIGIDVSESMVQTANKIKIEKSIDNVEFILADITQLNNFNTNHFDLATISMAIHQFDTNKGIQALIELKRVAKEILIIDYSCPLPSGYLKQFIYFIERIAGKEHFKNFKTYQKNGGIHMYLEKLKLTLIAHTSYGGSLFSLVHCK